MLVFTHTIPGEGGVCACTFETLLPELVLVLAVDEAGPAGEGLFGAVLDGLAGGFAAGLLDAAVEDELDTAPVSPLFFDFLLFVDSVVAAGAVAAVLLDAAGDDELDAVPASPLFFDFLLLVDSVVAAGVFAAALPDAGADELDAVPASPLFFDFLLFVDFVVEPVSWEVVDWFGVV